MRKIKTSQGGEGAGRDAISALAVHRQVALPAVPACLDEGPLVGVHATQGQHEEVVLSAAGSSEADGQHDAAIP